MERWRGSFAEIQSLDLNKLLPNLDALSSELDRRFEQIGHMLVGEAPTQPTQATTLTVDQGDVLWALAYLLFLPGDRLDSFEKVAYFSAVTFTTLGYGDITLLEHDWRLLSGIEALDGVLLVGWTTAFLFAVVQRSWRNVAHAHGKD